MTDTPMTPEEADRKHREYLDMILPRMQAVRDFYTSIHGEGICGTSQVTAKTSDRVRSVAG